MSGCPVKHGQDGAKESPFLAAVNAANNPAAGEKPASCPVMSAQPAGDCSSVNPLNNMMIQERQKPAPNQKETLSTKRETSTIPKGEVNPDHQSKDSQNWEYPSPQMFYNAMLRKGWNPSEGDMNTIVNIHNNVNEQSWHQIQIWESLHPETADSIKLKRFIGRPKDLTPKARLRSWFSGTTPFDRHDWIVDRNGEEVRYVIDFYSGTRAEVPYVEIDARPAIDGVQSFVDRLRMNFRKIF
eukprot:m.232561 g.232561  ORF g.232561 m.232561 type:complete len:241 (-) comp18778_c0_seq1:86-808(-)